METNNAFYINKIKEDLSLKQRANPQYSLRAYAKHLGVHSSTLSQVLTGKRGLPYIRNTILHTGILAFKNQKRIIKVGESPSLHYWGGEFLYNLRERYSANSSYRHLSR